MSFLSNYFAKSLQPQTLFFKFLISVHQNREYLGIPHTNQVSISRGRAKESVSNKVPT